MTHCRDWIHLPSPWIVTVTLVDHTEAWFSTLFLISGQSLLLSHCPFDLSVKISGCLLSPSKIPNCFSWGGKKLKSLFIFLNISCYCFSVASLKFPLYKQLKRAKDFRGIHIEIGRLILFFPSISSFSSSCELYLTTSEANKMWPPAWISAISHCTG